jgi:radical SAM protein with 4Fe4S-binding SPASM domain
MKINKWQLSRMAIIRKKDFFQVVTPSGGVYELDEESLRSLLMIGKGVIPPKKEVLDFAVRECLAGKSDNPEQPFDIDVVLNNLANVRMSILTLSDLALLITRKCNYQCQGCSVSAPKSNTKEMPLSSWKKVLLDARKFGALNLAISGGEPIMPQTIDTVLKAVEYATNNGFKKIVVASNGSFLPRYVKDLKAAGVKRISLSYYPKGEYGPAYTGCPRARENFLRAVEAITSAGIDLRLNCVTTKPMIGIFDEVVKDALQIMSEGHTYLRFSPLIEVGDAKSLNSFRLDFNDYLLLLKKIKRLKKEHGNKIMLTCDEDCGLEDPMICDAGLIYAIVNEKGEVSACDLLESVLPIKNVQADSFFNIWNESSYWQEYRSVVSINKKCRQCSILNRKVCFGRCRALSYLRFGSLKMNKERRCLL